MLIGIKHRFLFIANSKTASTSIESVLAPFADINGAGSTRTKHMGWVECRKEYATLFDSPEFRPEDIFRFGVVREPIEWVRSWYNYRNTAKKNVASRFRKPMSFEEFWASDDWIKRRNQKSRFCDEDGECRFDLIVPLERLQDGMEKVCNALGISPEPIKKENRSSASVSRKDISSDVVNEINDYYESDYKFWREWSRNLDSYCVEYKPRPYVYPESFRTGSNAKWEVKDLGSPLVDYARLHVEPAPDRGPNVCRVRGTVLASQASLGGDWLLASRDDIGIHMIEWQLPSPQVAKRFPTKPDAAFCRFRQIDIVLDKSNSAVIYLLGARGEMVPIFELSRF